jgi:hypothetical protein
MELNPNLTYMLHSSGSQPLSGRGPVNSFFGKNRARYNWRQGPAVEKHCYKVQLLRAMPIIEITDEQNLRKILRIGTTNLTICNTQVISLSRHFPLELTTVHRPLYIYIYIYICSAFTNYHLLFFSAATAPHSLLHHPVNVHELEETQLETLLHYMEQSIKQNQDT